LAVGTGLALTSCVKAASARAFERGELKTLKKKENPMKIKTNIKAGPTT
jgi:hypothetical protein